MIKISIYELVEATDSILNFSLDHPVYFCSENVFPFLTLGFVYLFTNPNIITAKLLFRLDHPYLH